MSEEKKIPRIGVGVFLFRKNGEFLILKRKGAHGEGTWALIGGHMEFGETPEETASRETMEESALMIPADAFVRLGFTNDIMKSEDKHYVTIFMGALVPEGMDPINAEPHKAMEMKWIAREEMPSPVFLPLDHFLKQCAEPQKLVQNYKK